jgi:ABC-type phosphate transport system permease subunit
MYIPGSDRNSGGTALVLLILVISVYLIAIIFRNHYKKKMKW